MKKKRKRLFLKGLVALLLLLLWILLPVYVKATTPTVDMEEIYDAAGVEALWDLLPEQTRTLLEESGMTSIDENTILDLSMQEFLSLLWQGFLSQMQVPLQLLATLFGVILLAALFGVLEQSTLNSQTGKVYHTVGILIVSGMMLGPLADLLQQTVSLIEEIGGFFAGFIPMFAAVVAASGKPVSGFLYHGMLFSVVQVFQVVSVQLLLPLTSIYLAICITAAATDKVDVTVLTKSVRSVLLWVMGFLLMLFIAILTVKSFVAASADSVSLRAGRFLLGSLVPVVGSALSDAFTVLQGAFGVVRAAVGAFGILAMLACVLPTVLQLVGMLVILKIAQTAAGVLGLKSMDGLLSSLQFVVSFLQGVLLSYAMMFLISTSILLLVGGGG